MKESAYLASIAQEPSRLGRLVTYLRPRPRPVTVESIDPIRALALKLRCDPDHLRQAAKLAWDMGYSAGQKPVRFELGESALRNPFEEP